MKFIKIIQKEKKRSARKSFRIIITWICVNKPIAHVNSVATCKAVSSANHARSIMLQPKHNHLEINNAKIA